MSMQSMPIGSGTSISYREGGAGPDLLQIHGLGTGHRNFDLLTPLLTSRLRVLDIDLPGYGDSQGPGHDRTIETFAEDVAAFVEALGIGPVAVHGTSMGGCVGMVLAARHPELVARLVVTCSMARPDRAALMTFATWRTAGQSGSEALAELTALQGFSREFWEREEAEATLQSFVDALESTTPEEFLRDLRSLERMDISTDVTVIECEVLLLGADEDLMTPVEAASSGVGMTDLARLIPGSRLVVLEGCGHFISIERPQETADGIADFVLEQS